MACCALVAAVSAFAQDYPHKPVRLIAPFAAGSGGDVLARLLAEGMGRQLQQSIYIENRGGASGTIGTQAVAVAAPDGYTIGLGGMTTHVLAPTVFPKLAYDPVKSFAPVSLLATAPFVLATHPSVPVTDLASFIARAKAAPGSMAYGSAGVGSGPHLAGELLAQQAGIQVQHIPYKGGGTVISDLLGGQFQFAFATVPTLAEHIKAGRLRALAVTPRQRVAQLPEVPTFAEAGLPGVDTMPLFGLLAPAGVPAAIVERLSATLRTAVREGEMRTRLQAMGFLPVGSTPAAFAQRIREESAQWSAVVRKGNIQPE